jgi:hypothetical protein
LSKLNYHQNRDAIYLSFNGTYLVIPASDKKFGQITKLLKEGDEEGVIEVLTRKAVTIEEYVEGSGLTLRGGQLYDSENTALPAILNTRMQELKADDAPITYLANFWNNLKQNPSFRSREQLFKFLEQNGHPLTADGHFIAYRGVTHDFKDKHTRTFNNSPGMVLEMPREKVDDDPNRTCSYGFHVAAYEYANNFSKTVIEVKVNPRDVVAVPADYNGQKMRVCRFEVIQVCGGKLENEVAYQADTSNWDDIYADEKNYDEFDIADILDLAEEFKDRYIDRTILAARIQEEYEETNITIADVLEILNDNEAEWQ